jgi:hypothetical protein
VKKKGTAAAPPPASTRKTDQLGGSYAKEIQTEFDKSITTVALLGSGQSGLKERRAIAIALRKKGVRAIIPEDVIPPEMAPDIVEEFILGRDDVDLVFVSPDSWGPVLEFGQFAKNPKIVGKLRILVERKYHPVYGSGGYLTSAYLTHEVVYGHIYIRGSASDSRSEQSWIPSNKQLIIKITERYRQWKALSSK